MTEGLEVKKAFCFPQNSTMDELSTREALLSGLGFGVGSVKKTSLFKSLAKWVLKSVMWLIFIIWVLVIFLYPAGFFREVSEKWTQATENTPYGYTGSVFLLFSGPILIIAFLAIIHLVISGEEEFEEKKPSKGPNFRLWTFPVLVDGPFGVVSAAELIGILLFVLFVIWAVYAYTMQNVRLLSFFELTPKEKSLLLLELSGLRLGMIGLLCLAFLFLPVARGSVLLRLIGIPFEHATRYHVWLGHLTMLLFTLHGLFYVIAWAIQGRLLQEIVEWRKIGFANLAGVISLSAGLLMWVTSLPPVRRINFELFFYTHQLYVIFVVFLAMHVGDFIFSIAAGGIFIFILDRFLRFCQSRRTVNVISARSFPCGTMELVLSKPANLRYNALSFIFLQVRELSWLQWHPFSVSSSPLDGKHHLAILIKVLGQWTAKLEEKILYISEAEPQNVLPFRDNVSITTSVEGPYGHELPYHLMYENLILVAGGIGISPFLAIVSDVLHRISDRRPCLPRDILIIWAVKKSNELPLLSTVDMESICPSFSDKLNLDIRIYVTREAEPPLEEGKFETVTDSAVYPLSNGCNMSVLVGTGHNLWSGIYVIASIIGFVILMGLLQIFYIKPYKIDAWWYKGLLFLACMTASVIIFGGLVIGLWHLWERKTSTVEKIDKQNEDVDILHSHEPVEHKDVYQKNLATSTIIHYGVRPDFKEIFGNICESWGCVEVGVIVCGPHTLQSSVAKECRSQSLKRQRHHPIFHFNSHSFDL